VFYGLNLAWLLLAAGVFVLLFFVTAPYGRHVRGGWGPTLASRTGWLIMEAPSVLVFAAGFALGSHHGGACAWVFLLMWESHYVYRAFVYPFTRRDRARRMPLSVVALAVAFNGVNASLNALWLFELSGGYASAWLRDPRFVAGLLLFVSGMVVNRRADGALRRLRASRESDHAVPRGGLYRWISCPNYFAEIVEWTGWALATWSLPGLAFAVWTAANLVPRARANHRWYRQQFADYPRERKALVPGLW
jgi:3-oxo-5-alpha-steroid 4-dehydrogenase 1